MKTREREGTKDAGVWWAPLVTPRTYDGTSAAAASNARTMTTEMERREKEREDDGRNKWPRLGAHKAIE